MARAFAILVLMLATPAVYATDHTVGDTSGWETGVNYNNWVSGKKFVTGDTLSFTYGGSHAVDEVSENDYKNCNAGNAIRSYSDGQTKITLSKPGTHYYMCPTVGHCTGGMKLAVTVSDSSTPTTPTTPSTTPTTPSTTPTTPTSAGRPTTPATSNPTTPNKSNPSGAMGNFKRESVLVVVASLVLAPLLGLMD